MDREEAHSFTKAWHIKPIKQGGTIACQDEPNTQEFILLDGRAHSHIISSDGREICIGLFQGPMVMTPQIARTKGKQSLVSIQTTSDALVASMDTDTLMQRMISSVPIRNWANAILQNELVQKAEREWALAALSGRDRLIWFRTTYPGFEDRFGHVAIASFLGMTPVTLSRLRGAEK